MASSSVKEDKYRTYLRGDEEKNTKWIYGAPPNYDVVNKLFEDGKTKVSFSFSFCVTCCMCLLVYKNLVSFAIKKVYIFMKKLL